MDFVLGGDAEEAGSKIVAVEITKLIVDENGRRISPSASTNIVNSFDLYQDKNGNPNSVVGLNIDKYTTPANYNGYEKLHSKEVKVGHDGMGLVYDYAVTPGMFYIQEDQNSIPDMIEDVNGEKWHFVGTRIETESPWRDIPDYDGHMHVSDTYTKDTTEKTTEFNSIPEVLGNYNDINGKTTHIKDGKEEVIRNGFLEFFVYNIYEPEKTEVKVKKEWENGDAPVGASIDIVLKRYKLVPEGSITPPEPTTGELRITDSYTGLGGDRSYSATYHVTGPNEYNQTFNWTGETISIPDLPFGEYTVTKVASDQEGYDASNQHALETVMLSVAGADVIFTGTFYQRQGTDAHHRVWVYTADTLNLDKNKVVDGHYTWVEEEYPEGMAVTFTVGVPSWNDNSSYFYTINGATPVTIEKGKTKTETLTVDRDITIVINGSTPYYSQWLDPQPSVTVASRYRNMQMSAAKRAPLKTAAVINLSNEGKNPVIEGYTWQQDTTWYDGNGLTVHLPDGTSWEKTVEDLEKEDAYGNVFVYYIASVTENGMPSGMTAQISLDGVNKLFVYGDHSTEESSEHTNDTLKVKNTLATGTNINIQKVIKGTSTPLTGAQFTVRKYDDAAHRNEIKTDGFPLIRDVDNKGQIVLDNLKIGYYKLEESGTPAGYVKVSGDPYFEVRLNSTTKEVEVVFENSSMVSYANGTFTVQNEPGAALPNTGGPGTSLTYLVGLMLTGLAVTGLSMRRKKSKAA